MTLWVKQCPSDRTVVQFPESSLFVVGFLLVIINDIFGWTMVNHDLAGLDDKSSLV